MFKTYKHIANISKCYTALSLSRNYQVTIVGAAGGVGQPLSLLLKTSPLVSKLMLHDTHKQTPGVGVDLSHLPTDAAVKGFSGEGELETALRGADLVIVCAGATDRAPAEEQFKANSEMIPKVMLAVSKACPCALIAIVTSPINSLVPLAAEALRRAGTYDQRKLFGVTNASALRARTLYASAAGLSPACACVPVIGGNSPCTIVPLFSLASPPSALAPGDAAALVKRVRSANKDVMDAKAGEGTETMAAAYAASGLAQGLLEAMAGGPNVQYAYVQSNDFGTCFFGGPVLLDANGAFEMQTVGPLTKGECEMLEVAIDDIRKDVLKGQVRFSELYPRKKC